MPLAKNTRFIVGHCSAGFSGVESIKKYWENVLGWNAPGYCRLIDLDGKVHKLATFDSITNGVRGWNSNCIHICYIGGVLRDSSGKYVKDARGKFIAADTRTDAQKAAFHITIQEAIAWLESEGKDITKDLSILGHYHFSKDKNGNGIIDPYERIKECPSFDPMEEYGRLYGSADRYGKLPHVA